MLYFDAKLLLHVKQVFGFEKEHCCVEVSKGVKGYSFNPWILQFAGDSSSLGDEVFSELVKLEVSEDFLASFR